MNERVICLRNIKVHRLPIELDTFMRMFVEYNVDRCSPHLGITIVYVLVILVRQLLVIYLLPFEFVYF